MKVIVGLGNPGTEYQNTRHNVGVMVVDKIYESKFMNYEYGFRRKKDIYVYESNDLVLVKTANIFMNESGKIIAELKYMNFGFDDIYMVHDDLDIKLGEFKIQFGRGPKEHNGINSVESALGTDQFWRVRIGIDNRNEPSFAKATKGEEYVLSKFAPDEKPVLNRVMEEIVAELMKPV